MAIYKVAPFVAAEKQSTRKRKRHIAKVSSIKALNSWLKDAENISIYSCN